MTWVEGSIILIPTLAAGAAILFTPTYTVNSVARYRRGYQVKITKKVFGFAPKTRIFIGQGENFWSLERKGRAKARDIAMIHDAIINKDVIEEVTPPEAA